MEEYSRPATLKDLRILIVALNAQGADYHFRRGRNLARIADSGAPLPQKPITSPRLTLFRVIKEMPGSIT